MFTQTSILFLASTLLFANTQLLLGQPDAAAADRLVKAQVTKLGPGKKVTVILKDGTRVNGSISQILDDSFDVTLLNQAQSSTISYRDVQNVKKRGWSNTAKLGLGLGIGAAAVAVVIVVALASIKDGFGSVRVN